MSETITKIKFSDKDFVKAWLDSKSYDSLACKLELTTSATQARATRLRKAGVKLPPFSRVKRAVKKIDTVGLNHMIESETSDE